MNTVAVVRRHEHLNLGREDTELHRAVRDGRLQRIAPGSYVRPSEWVTLDPMEQHRMRVLAPPRRLPLDTVYSHFAAAALWGIRLLGQWPDKIHVTSARASGGRSEGRIARHCTGIPSSGVTSLGGLLLTTPAQTVVDLARTLPFADAVVAMDSALKNRRQTPLTRFAAITAALDESSHIRASSRARAVAAFATTLSDSPQESHSRVLLHTLGFPTPELQRSFALPGGGTAEVDFYWESFGHAGECDGRAKYRDPRILRGRRPEDVVIQEKNRENELRRVVGQISRWEPAELYHPRTFYDRLTRDGLPSTRPRP